MPLKNLRNFKNFACQKDRLGFGGKEGILGHCWRKADIDGETVATVQYA